MKRKNYYRYVILACCFLLMAFPFSIINSIHSLFITPVTTALGFSKTAFSFLFTISALTVALFSPLIGKLIQKIPLRIIMTICSFFAGGGFIAYSFCKRITSFYLVAFFVAIGLTGLTTIPVSVMLTHWFPKKKGTALGIAFAGIGTGTFFFMQIITRLISSKGYEFSYLFLGILILAVTLPISVYLVEKAPPVIVKVADTKKKWKHHRDHSKMNPELTEESMDASLSKNNITSKDESIKKLPFGFNFLCFLSALFLLGMTISGTKIHVQPYLDVSGYNAIHNANVGSTIAFVSLFGNLAAGRIFDKFGLRRSIFLYGTFSLLSCICLMLIGTDWISYLFAVFFGLSLNLPGLLPSYGVTVLFPKHEYATTLGFTNAIFTLGSSIGPTLTGLFADHHWGYRGAWLCYSAVVIAYVWILSLCTSKKS